MTAAELVARVLVRRAECVVEVELEVAAGETLAIMGPSGAGKTTVLDALSGLMHLAAGQIRLGSQEQANAASGVHLAPSRRRVGRLGQDAELFPHFSVRENIAFAIRAQGADARSARASADDWLRRAGLSEFAERRPAALSGGQAKRVALLRALAARPRLLLLDEPLASLDVEAAADMRALVSTQLSDRQTTTILVSHDARDAFALADRTVIIEGGRITQSGAMSAVLASPATRFVAALAASVAPATRSGRVHHG